MNRGMANRRMKRELELLSRGGAAPGIAAWPRDEGDRLDVLDAEIRGASDTPYEGGIFRLEVVIPAEYPLKPPRVRFVTKIYHPNIDSQGRICLDSLNMPPKGAWKPSLNVSTLLTTIQALMSEPNGDDGLMVEITEEFRRRPEVFRNKARECTRKYACGEVAVRGMGLDGDKADSATGDTEELDVAENREGESGNVKDQDEDEIRPVKGTSSEEGAVTSRLRKKPRYS